MYQMLQRADFHQRNYSALNTAVAAGSDPLLNNFLSGNNAIAAGSPAV
jgi:hypothetical protein